MKLFKKFKFRKPNLKNSVTLYASGYNLERTLNLLLAKGIRLLSVRKYDVKKLEIEVSSADEGFVCNFLNKKNIKIQKKKFHGFASCVHFFRYRYGILIGVFFVFCCAVVANNYVWDIQVMGNETRDVNEIISVLNENDINLFDAINEKSNEEIERIVLDNFSEVSMVSVVKKGTTIIINIKEKLLNDEHENLGDYTPLLSVSDGIITSTQLIQGTLLVKVGDTVRTGDELVAPYVTDSSGNRIPIQPKAKIVADVWLSGQSEHHDSIEVTERTGNVEIERKIVFLEKDIFTKQASVFFERYETEVIETCMGDSLLPMKYLVTTYYETITKNIEQDFTEVQEQKIDEAKNLAHMQVRENETISSENYLITRENEKTIVDYVITVSRTIS